MKRKILVILLSTCLVLVGLVSLLGCGNKTSSAPYNLILANNDDMALGAIASLGSNEAKNIPIIGVDALPGAQDAVNAGTMAATVKQQGELMAKATVDISAKILNDGLTPLDALAATPYGTEQEYADVDLDVGLSNLNYTKKDGVVRIPYLPYTGANRQSEDKNTQATNTRASIPTDVKISVMIFQQENAYMTSVVKAFEEEFSASGMLSDNYTFYYGETNQETQNSQVDTEVGKEVDLLIVNPVDPYATQNILNKANSKNIPIIFINKQDPQFDYATNNTIYIGSDLDGGGAMQGKIVADLLKTGGKFAAQKQDNSEVKIRAMVLFGERGHPDAIYRTLTWIVSAQKELEGTGIVIDFESKIDSNENIKYMPTGQDWTIDGAKATIDSLKVSPGFQSPKNL